MKCQKCERPATFHITELTSDEVMALHFCAECAEKYLKPASGATEAAPTLAGVLAQQLKVGQTAEELARLDQKACPICGITFYEFRQSGRLGCPHDYIFFEQELSPLIANVHGDVRHTGKRPKRGAINSDSQTELIRLRREMKEAIDKEDYEQASRLRDQIHQIEEEGQS